MAASATVRPVRYGRCLFIALQLTARLSQTTRGFISFIFHPRTTATQTFFYNCKILQLSSAAKLRFCLELNLPFSFSDAQFSKTL